MLLTTYKKDGTAVPTPVWVMDVGGELQVWTNPRTGKYKRIRNNPRVTVQPCTFRGEPRGESVTASARLLTDSELKPLMEAIKRKYGLFGRWTVWQSRLATKLRHWPATSGLAVTLD